LNGAVKEVTEERTKLLIPTGLNAKPSMKNPFYNPQAKLTRDVSIAVESAACNQRILPARTMLDIMAGIGARGLRVAKESERFEDIHLNDLNTDAVELAIQAARLNNVTENCHFTSIPVEDFRRQHQSTYGIVDLDPFGSPALYLHHCIKLLADGGILQVGATDSTVLSGLYPQIALERYGGISARTSYAKELGARILLRKIAIIAQMEDFEVEPLIVHTSHHYTRLYVRLKRKRSASIEVPSATANLCQRCGNPWNEELGTCGGSCLESHHTKAGPFWNGSLQEKDFIEHTIREAEVRNLNRAVKLLDLALGEVGMPRFYFNLDEFAQEVRVASIKVNTAVATLQEQGYRASPTVFDPKGVKTDAPYAVMKDLLVRVR
jgi:tRNA (guanine26-N2/guanine27-N2)-dimethyltransferase